MGKPYNNYTTPVDTEGEYVAPEISFCFEDTLSSVIFSQNPNAVVLLFWMAEIGAKENTADASPLHRQRARYSVKLLISDSAIIAEG